LSRNTPKHVFSTQLGYNTGTEEERKQEKKSTGSEEIILEVLRMGPARRSDFGKTQDIQFHLSAATDHDQGTTRAGTTRKGTRTSHTQKKFCLP
jgi:hypothetical protein